MDDTTTIVEKKEKKRIKATLDYFRSHLWVLFLVAFVLGGGIKAVASEFVTIGYGDYLVNQQGVDFGEMQEKLKQKQEEAQKKQAQAQAPSGEEGETALPTGAACGS